LDDTEYKKLRFMFGIEAAQYSPQVILRGDKTVGEAVFDASERDLYVVLKLDN
jgi:hypothetical protein